MFEIKFVDIFWVCIRNVELCGGTIRETYFPQCGANPWRFIHKITDINVTTCFTRLTFIAIEYAKQDIKKLIRGGRKIKT